MNTIEVDERDTILGFHIKAFEAKIKKKSRQKCFKDFFSNCADNLE